MKKVNSDEVYDYIKVLDDIIIDEIDYIKGMKELEVCNELIYIHDYRLRQVRRLRNKLYLGYFGNKFKKNFWFKK